ncbi:MAG: signal recognition particle protein [Alphaproteobacteria bacterium]|nr:signal recognition particle protein [Alphaproteobacteria bacterium]
MFNSFSEKISGILEKLRRSGVLKEEDVDTALREIRIALLEADVSLDIARKFISEVKEKAIGQNVLKSVSPGQMVIKIVYDYIVELLGKSEPINLNKSPYKIMLVGLQGAGKTTTAAKLANFFSKNNNPKVNSSKKSKKVLLASTDIYRPAAINQLKILSSKIENALFLQDESDKNLSAAQIAKNALKNLKETDSDVLIIDTAGRLQIDEVKMDELVELEKIVQPDEIILVANIMTGQESFNVAKRFSEVLNISGIILTQVDGDARGGVALSMKSVTNCPIRFLCVGEKLEDIELFNAERIASRMLDMGDIVSLVEKAQENFSQEEAFADLKKMQSGVFTFDDLASQIERMSKLGGLKMIVKMLPQSKQIQEAMAAQGLSDKTILRNLAIIKSMTKKEKTNHKLLNGSRKKRIAKGSGTTIQEVNKLIKQYENALALFKKIKRGGGFSKLFGMMGR